jgi:DNA-binding SARP family transcriptional activator
VSLLGGRAADEEAERSPRRILRAPRDLDQELCHGAIVRDTSCGYLGEILETRIQLCGKLVARLEGRRLEDRLPGRQGRLLFAYLVASRLRPATRAELIDAIWPSQPPIAAEAALSALLSKLRRLVPIESHGGPQIVLPEGAFVDVEAADEAIHRAEAGTRQSAWAPARIALHTASRTFLPGEDASWISERRHHLEDVRLRALECVAEAGIGLGGTELDSALRAGRALIELAPLRESGYRLLMRALEADGNRAEALAVYDRLRRTVRDELGAAPSRTTQELHKSLLR